VAFVKLKDGRAIKQGAIHLESLIPKVGLEPTPPCGDRILSPARLPSVWYWADIGLTQFSGILRRFTMTPAVVRVVVALG
jgi:hypothetical protein